MTTVAVARQWTVEESSCPEHQLIFMVLVRIVQGEISQVGSLTNQGSLVSNSILAFDLDLPAYMPHKVWQRWGDAQQSGSRLASHPVAPGSILSVPKNFFLDVAEIY